MDREWTARLVEERLMEAFRSFPGAGIYSPTRTSLRVVIGTRVEGIELIGLSTQVLRSADPVRCRRWRGPTLALALLTYARAEAIGDPSVREVCAQRDWPRQNFDDARKLASQKVAEWINMARAMEPA